MRSLKVLLVLILMSSCGDRDLSSSSGTIDENSPDLYLFGVRKNLNGYSGLLSLNENTAISISFNLNSNKINLSNVSEGQLECTGDYCTTDWFSFTPQNPNDLTTTEIIKRDLIFTITTTNVDFFVTEAPITDAQESVCDSSFGDLQAGSKVTISLFFGDKEISRSLVFELGAANNIGGFPTLVERPIRTSATYALDLDSYYAMPGFRRFEHSGSHRQNDSESFYIIDAGNPLHSVRQRLCVNEN